MAVQELAVPRQSIDIVFGQYKEQLVALLRYDRFRVNETPQEWVHLLGPDVSSLTHPEVTANITERFIAYNAAHGTNLSLADEVLLQTAARTHDWGELTIAGKGVGDVTFEAKMGAHEQVELQIFSYLLGLIPEDADRKLIKRAYTEIALDKRSRLGQMFNAIERLGYLETAIRAYQGVDGKRISNWQGLVGNVLSNQIEALLKYSQEYPYVQFVIESNRGIVGEMLSAVLAADVFIDNQGKPSYDRTKLERSQAAWSGKPVL